MKKLTILVATLALLTPPLSLGSETALELEALLQSVRDGRASDEAANRERIAEFERERGSRQTILDETIAERKSLEDLSTRKEKEFEENELLIAELEKRLQDRMGSLKELFGVLQQVSGDAQSQFHGSLAQLEHPGREAFLVDFAGRMGQANRLPEISEIEQLWFELQREMTASAQVQTASRAVINDDGAEVSMDVTRIGLFSVVADGKFLKFIPETGRLVEYGRQPPSRYLTGLAAIADASDEVTPIAIDPVRGQLIDILTQAPDLLERIAQGGTIGYTIIALGAFGVALALFRLTALLRESRRIRQQLMSLESPSDENPLGRIMLAAHEEDLPDIDTIELRMSEAVLRETPRINAYIPLLKIIAAVAPLMGLLGTVTGMIVTFQAITLFGAGDPRLMAGGISQALMTTVLGLCVAVPMLLLHNIVQMRARAISEILQQKAVSVVAQHVETHNMKAEAA